jgi:hypothetical protein
MADNSPTTRVLAIKLLEFKYDRKFKAADGTPVQYNVQIKHRIPAKSSRLEVVVSITYTEKNSDRTDPLLSTECLTVYQLIDSKTEVEEETGKEVVQLPVELMQRLFLEAIAHSRALLAVQTAGTAFNGTHVDIRDELPV